MKENTWFHCIHCNQDFQGARIIQDEVNPGGRWACPYPDCDGSSPYMGVGGDIQYTESDEDNYACSIQPVEDVDALVRWMCREGNEIEFGGKNLCPVCGAFREEKDEKCQECGVLFDSPECS
jgi:hypothetical protein